jgi:hypothetical protein
MRDEREWEGKGLGAGRLGRPRTTTKRRKTGSSRAIVHSGTASNQYHRQEMCIFIDSARITRSNAHASEQGALTPAQNNLTHASNAHIQRMHRNCILCTLRDALNMRKLDMGAHKRC